MILPWGGIDDIFKRIDADEEVSVIGCLSFERRCSIVPLWSLNLTNRMRLRYLIKVNPIKGAFPDFSDQTRAGVGNVRRILEAQSLAFEEDTAELLAPEDNLISCIDKFQARAYGTTVILDITSFPKRYFCFFVQQLLLRGAFENVIVTYTEAGHGGYTAESLAGDPLSPDYLPGFPFSLPDASRTLVVSVGFEPLGLRSVIEFHAADRIPKLLMSISNDHDAVTRQWATVRKVFGSKTEPLGKAIKVVAPWDVESVYETLDYWNGDSDGGLTLAPFGVKPHTLAMTLFAIKNRCCLTYTQPRSYNPNYTRGHGMTWAYVIKWDGIACFDRPAGVI